MTTVYDRISGLRNCKTSAEVEPICVEMFALMDTQGTGKVNAEQYAAFCEDQFNYALGKAEEDKKAMIRDMWAAVKADPSNERHP